MITLTRFDKVTAVFAIQLLWHKRISQHVICAQHAIGRFLINYIDQLWYLNNDAGACGILLLVLKFAISTVRKILRARLVWYISMMGKLGLRFCRLWFRLQLWSKVRHTEENVTSSRWLTKLPRYLKCVLKIDWWHIIYSLFHVNYTGHWACR